MKKWHLKPDFGEILIAQGSFTYHFDVYGVFLNIVNAWEFFTPVLTDGVSLESEWQQVSSSLLDSSQYSSRS